MRFRFGEFQLDVGRFTLSGPAGPVHVEPQVFEVLHQLILDHDRVVSKEELLDAVWGDRFVSESALTSRIKAARRAVGDDGQAQRVIKTVHGRGYQFVAEVRAETSRDRRALPRLRNLPLGRDGDIDRIVERLREARLATVTGTGGIGKTTVALAVADRLQAEWADGVVFVDLSPVPPPGTSRGRWPRPPGWRARPRRRPSAWRSTWRTARSSSSSTTASTSWNGRPTSSTASWSAASPPTSCARAASRSAWRESTCGPWAPPRAGPALFVERARAAEPRVHWDPADPAVVELCRRLDHVPLALELAAGQLRRFDLDELSRRLDDRLTLLSGRAPGDAPRHATMETAIDWSYRLLDPAEQSLLRHLSVFPSSFDVGAVEASAPPLPGAELVTVFGRLVDKSLVVRQPGSGRYRLLETIRVFAGDRLDEAHEAAAAFERHRGHVRERIGSTSRLDRWMSARLGAELRTDLEDVRQAFRLSVEQGKDDDAVEIAVGASFLWRNAIGCVEGDAWVGRLVALDLTTHDQLWVQILRADVGQGRGDHRQMFGAAASAEELADRADDPAAACLAAHYGALAHLTDPEQAQHRLEAALVWPASRATRAS